MDISGLVLFENNPYFFLAAFAILGGGIKYIDDAFDERTFSKDRAVFTAPVLGVLWAYTSLVNGAAGTILLAIILSVFLTGKIDNRAHKIGLVTVIALLILAGFEIMWIPLAVLVIAGIFDEKGNDIMDEKAKSFTFNGTIKKFIIQFFRYRCVMKIGVVALTIIGTIPIYLFAAFLLFDIAYHIVSKISKKKKTGSSDLALPWFGQNFSFLDS